MYKFLSKRGTLIATIVGGVLAIAFLIVATGTVPNGLSPDIFRDGTTPKPTSEVKDILAGIKSFDIGFYTTYVFLALAAAAAVILSLFNFVKNFSVNNLKSLIPILVLIIVFFVVYSTYSPDTSDVYAVKKVRKTFEVMNNESQIISGGIWSAGFGLLAALASLAVMEAINIFK
jgi:hypothetical protein